MRYETINDPVLINKLYRPRKIQAQVLDFHDSNDRVRRIVYEEGEYQNAKNAQTTFLSAIRKLRLQPTMKACILEGRLYLIKLETED